MNTVNLIGRLTRDPELRNTQSGVACCSFSLAVDRNFKNANGEREVDFIDVVVWRQLGENCAKYLRKGKLAGVTGRLQVQNYEARDGSKRKAYSVVADGVQFLSPRDDSAPAASLPEPEAPPFGPDEDDSDLPF